MYVRGEYNKDGWVPSSGVAPLSWWFSIGLVSELASSVVSSSLVWLKSTVGRTMVSIFPSDTSFIIFILLMCPERSGMMDQLLGVFLIGSTYSELWPLPPKMASGVMSL